VFVGVIVAYGGDVALERHLLLPGDLFRQYWSKTAAQPTPWKHWRVPYAARDGFR